MDGDTPAEKPPRYRHDGWTPARQAEFCEALRRNGSVTEACAAVGKAIAVAVPLVRGATAKPRSAAKARRTAKPRKSHA